jgi:hypothetical protein
MKDPRDNNGNYFPIDGNKIFGLEAGVQYTFSHVHPDVVGTFGGLQSMIVHFVDPSGEQCLVQYRPIGLAFRERDKKRLHHNLGSAGFTFEEAHKMHHICTTKTRRTLNTNSVV